MPVDLGERIEEQGQIGDLSLRKGKRQAGVVNEALTDPPGRVRSLLFCEHAARRIDAE
jgi:hypothetical protein